VGKKRGRVRDGKGKGKGATLRLLEREKEVTRGVLGKHGTSLKKSGALAPASPERATNTFNALSKEWGLNRKGKTNVTPLHPTIGKEPEEREGASRKYTKCSKLNRYSKGEE